MRYAIESKGIELHTDVLFRSFQLFNQGEIVYISLEKRNVLEINDESEV